MAITITDSGNYIQFDDGTTIKSLNKPFEYEVKPVDGSIRFYNDVNSVQYAYSDITTPSSVDIYDLASIVMAYNNTAIQKTDITSPLSSQGNVSVDNDETFINGHCVYSLIPANFRTFTDSGGGTSATDRVFKVNSGTSVGGYGAIQSFRSVNFKVGQGAFAIFPFLFESSAANSWQGAGFISVTDELSFGYNGTTFGIWHRYGGVAEVRTIEVTGASGGSTDLTLTLNSVPYTIPLTAGTTAHNAYEIETWLNANQSVWVADQIGSTIIIAAQTDGAKSGTYSYSHATSTGTITQNKAGVAKTNTDHIPQTQWSHNQCEWLDVTKYNLAKIVFNGNAQFYLEDPTTGLFTLCHVLQWLNLESTRILNNASMRVGVYAVNLTNTTNLVARAEYFRAGVQGSINKTRNPRAVSNTQSVTTTFTNVLTLRNRRTYNYYYNQVEVEPLLLTISSESAKSVTIEVRSNVTPAADTNFANAGTNLVSDIDVSAIGYSGGTLLASTTIAPNGRSDIDLSKLFLRVPPTLRITIGAKITSGAASNVTATLNYFEDL